MIDGTLQKVCDFFNLGRMLRAVPMSGARSHAVYHITADQGDYIVKQFMAHCHEPIDVAVLRSTAAIARCGFEYKLPVISALFAAGHADGDVLCVERGAVYMAYPYIQAYTRSAREMTLEQGKLIAQFLVRFHQLNLTPPTPRPVWNLQYTSSIWIAVHRYFLEHSHATAALLLERLHSKIMFCFTACQASKTFIVPDLVISHRDIDPLNILWLSNTEYRVIDWDLAGEVDAAVELLYVAIGLALESATHLNSEKFKAIVATYCSQRTVHTKDVTPVLYTVLAYWLSWVQEQLHKLVYQEFDLNQFHRIVESVCYSLQAMEYLLQIQQQLVELFASSIASGEVMSAS